LSGKKVLQLNVEFLLLLNNDILLDDLFGLLDQSLLQCLDLLEHLPSVWISTFELSPSVDVQGVLKLFRESLDLQSFFHNHVLEVVNFLS